MSVSGLVLQVAGLALDAALHANDSTLAAREGVFTLANPGHLLFAVGLALTVGGAGARYLVAPRSGRPIANTAVEKRFVRMMIVVIVAGSAVVVGRTISHRHGGGHDPVHRPQVALSWDQLREIDNMLTLAEAATTQYSDLTRARVAGYRQLTHVYPGTGAHFVDLDALATGSFDLTRPPVLLYDIGTHASWELVGVAWVLPGGPDDAAPPYVAPLGRWHYHDETARCLRPRGPDATGETSTAAVCTEMGGVFVERGHWMLHAWLFRDSPQGVFAGRNSTIRGAHPFD